jgi:3-keto-disaccharide hydrolase
VLVAQGDYKMADRSQAIVGGRFLGLSATALALAAIWSCAMIGLAREPAEKNGFVALTGKDGREQWIGYGLDVAKDSWPANWEFVDGVLHTKGSGVDLKTRKQYRDFDLRFEWKVPPGANSGVMYRVSQETDPAYYTGPEYQIIDNVLNADGASPDTSAASVYALYPPSKDVTKPAGSWNEARIVVCGNHVEHYLNGEKVVDYQLGSADWKQRVAASKFAAWKKFGTNRRGHIVLQNHGNDVWYRSVRIKSLDGGK